MKIAVGSDHRGFKLKNEILEMLHQEKLNFKDLGIYAAKTIDYPDIAYKISQEVASGKFTRGIIICGTGIGMNIVANKIKGIRAVLCNDVYSAQMSRAHNNTNVLNLGEKVIGFGLARIIVKTWLSTKFEGGRHINRLAKIEAIEQKFFCKI